MSYKYLEINGVKVLRKIFNDTKSEQEFLARFPRKMEPGFVTVHQWQPGHTSTNRAEERYISAIDFYIAPVVNGKPDMELGQEAKPGDPVPAPVSLEVPEEIKAATDVTLLTWAPQIGAKVNQRMPRPQLMAAMCLAIKKQPKLWETLRARLAENKLKADSMKTASVTA